MLKRKVVVIAPTFNEKSSVEKLIEQILNQQEKLDNFDLNVLIVDSNSPDKTGKLVEKIAEKNKKVYLLEVGERGLGLALVKGLEYAVERLKADVLMQIDADLQHNPAEIPLFLEKIDQDFDYVQGSRYTRGGGNKISFLRQLFSIGSSLAVRLLTGIWQINDFTPSFKAFTTALYKKMDWRSIPWQGMTFLIEPAEVIEAFRAGAKMTQVPIRFKDRDSDRSKNQVFNYIIDILGYSLEFRLAKMGLQLPVLLWARRSKTLIKFGAVGMVGTMVDLLFYNIFIAKMGIPPATAKAFSTEIAIINNFILNNSWTFKRRKTKNSLWKKMVIFNIVSLGGLALSVGIIKMLHLLYGDGVAQINFVKIHYYNLYFFVTIPFVMSWNFLMNHLVTWKKEEEHLKY